MSAYTTRLKLEKQVSGENSGNWGNLVNYVFNRIDSTVRGYVTLSVAGTANVTLVSNTSTTNTTESADDQVHNKVIELTGTLGASIHVFTDAVEGEYIIYNNTAGAYSLTFANTGHAANGVAITQGSRAILYSDGSTIYDALNGVALTNPKIITGLNDVNGNELLKVTATASAINELTLTNKAAGSAPEISATGGDTNIGITLTPKGSGAVKLDLLTFPTVTGSADQVLTTNGSGVLSFVDNSGGTSWIAVKTSGFTAVAGEGYFCNTTGGAFSVALPAGTLGDEITLVDYAGTFDTNNLTVAPNGSEKIQGVAASLTVSIERAGLTLCYVDATQGWLLKDK